MNTLNCNYGDKCKFYHPIMLTSASQNTGSIITQGYNHDFPTYAHIAKKNVQPHLNSFHQSSIERSPFLGQVEQSQKTVLSENQNQQIVQNPFLEFMKSQREILRRLEQLETQNSQNQNTLKKW